MRDINLSSAHHKDLPREERILIAFQECVVENGLDATGLNEVAQRAGVGRQTIYRKFENREKLTQLAMMHRFRIFADQATRAIAEAATIEDAIVWGSVVTVKGIGRDKFYRAIGGWAAVAKTNMLSLNSNRGSAELILPVWGPLLVKAQAQGRLNPQITIEEGAEYLANMHWLLTWRPDLDEKGLAAFLRKFCVPALITNPLASQPSSGKTQRRRLSSSKAMRLPS